MSAARIVPGIAMLAGAVAAAPLRDARGAG
jgi:hypothetical protein